MLMKTDSTLTREDIVALRKADDVSFHRLPERSFIRASKRQSRDSVFTNGTDADREIACESILTDYEYSQNGSVPLGDAWSGFEMIHCSSNSLEWQTIAGMLRTGDTIRLNWARGAAGTEGNRARGLVGDRLYLRVIRGEKTLSFFLSEYTGENNTARMVRSCSPGRV